MLNKDLSFQDYRFNTTDVTMLPGKHPKKNVLNKHQLQHVRGGFPPEELEGGDHGVAQGNRPGHLQPSDQRWSGQPTAELPVREA